MRRLLFIPIVAAAASFPAFASVDAGLLALLPPGAKIISGVDFERARNSQFGQFMTGKMKTGNQDFENFVTETGFDPRHDLQEVLFASTGPDANGDSSRFVILARGYFDQERITAAAKTKGMIPHTFQGVVLFVDNHPAKRSTGFAFLDGGIGVIGDVDTVKKIISNRGTEGVLDPALQAQVYKVGEDNDAWFVSSVAGDYLATHFNRGQSSGASSNSVSQSMAHSQAVQSVLQASGGLHFGDSVEISFEAVTRSAKDATSLADVVRFFASMVEMQREKDPRAGIAASALDNMSLKTEGDSMYLSISLPEKSLEQLVDSSDRGVVRPHSHAQ
jgi:hypothetical protein